MRHSFQQAPCKLQASADIHVGWRSFLTKIPQRLTPLGDRSQGPGLDSVTFAAVALNNIHHPSIHRQATNSQHLIADLTMPYPGASAYRAILQKDCDLKYGRCCSCQSRGMKALSRVCAGEVKRGPTGRDPDPPPPAPLLVRCRRCLHNNANFWSHCAMCNGQL